MGFGDGSNDLRQKTLKKKQHGTIEEAGGFTGED